MTNFCRQISAKFLQRKTDANKGDFGHVLVLGGDCGMGGAAIMAAEAASRIGAGKVSVLTRNFHVAPLLARCPNVMTIAEEETSPEIFAGKNSIAIGCGLGKSAWSHVLFDLALSQKIAKIIDADALNLLAKSDKKFDLSNSILTPHVGEAARLLGLLPQEIQRNRKNAVKNLYEKFGAVSVLKGAGSLVFGSGDEIYECAFGNPGMATAGMGDVLSGIISGLLAQGLSLKEAAVSGVEIHALAGDFAARKRGQIGLSPLDVIDAVGPILKELQEVSS